MPAQLIAVTRTAFIEAIRQPFYVVWLLVIGFGIILNPYLAAYTFEDDNKLATDMGLSMLLVGGLVLAAFTASGVISREIENRTALTVISKPIPRPTFILGKFLGVIGALVMAWWNWSFLHLLAIRQGAFSTAGTPWDFPVLIFGSLAILAAVGVAVTKNYLFNTHFGAAFSKWLALLLPVAYLVAMPLDHEFHAVSPLTHLPLMMIMAMFFVLQAVFLLAAIATACSTRLGQVSTLVICLVVFFLGLSSDYVFGERAVDQFNDSGQLVERGATWAKVAYAVIPNLGFHWLADALTQGTIDAVDATYFLQVSGYTLLLVVGILGLAIALFQTRQAA